MFDIWSWMSVAEKFDIRTPPDFSFALALLGIIYILYIYEKERKLKQRMLFLAELRPSKWTAHLYPSI